MAVAVAIYAGFAGVAMLAPHMPPLLTAIAGGWFVAWHGSLQHEVVHGHPTPWPLVNRLLVLPSLWLWLPFEDYRRTHLRHHRGTMLTVPGADPETPFLAAPHYARLPLPARAWLHAERCLLGAMALRPLRQPLAYARNAWRDRSVTPRELGVHAVGCALPLGFAMGIAGLSVAEYLLLFVYPGVAFTTLRSFGEHSWDESVHSRSNITLCRWPLALLFLNNNLHALHHREPRLAWYRIPARLRELQGASRNDRPADASLSANRVFAGYLEVLRLYGLRPRLPIEYPGSPHA